MRLVLLTLLLIPCASAQTTKKLIEFGWDEPDTAFMLSHISEMEKTPFDGTVYHVDYTKPDGTRGRFMSEGWGKRTFTEVDLRAGIDELKRTQFKKFTQNLLRFNVLPGDVDWFDDFGAVTSNAKLSARIARQGKSRGVLFDIEQYGFPLWTYSKQRDASTKSWDEYATQARVRGEEVMRAFQEGFGDNVIVFLTFAYALPHSGASGDPDKLKDAEYGLLKPFLDGMLDAAKPGAKVVEGYELSYGYRDPKQFAAAEETVHRTLPKFAADAKKYEQFISLSFGLWMDYDWRNKGWDAADVSKNYFTPDGFEKSLTEALRTADEFVWIYTEDAKWWSANGRVKLPDAYLQAVERAKK